MPASQNTGTQATTQPPPADPLEEAVKLAEKALADARAKWDGKQTANATAKEADVARDAYAAAKPAIDAAQANLEAFVRHETACLDQIVPDAKAKVPEIARAEADDRKAKVDAVAAARAAQASAEADLAAAKALVEQQKAALAMLQKLGSAIRDRQARAAAVRAAIQKAAADGAYARAYWLLVQELIPLVTGEPKVRTPDELRAALLAAKEALSEAEAAIEAKSAAVAVAKGGADAAQKDLESFDKDSGVRIAATLDAIKPAGPAKPYPEEQ